MSIRLKITLWFSALLILILALTYFVIFSISDNILQKSIRDNLIEIVENNVDEIEFFPSMNYVENDNDNDLYIKLGNGILEIDDDYLDQVNGMYISLYQQDGTLIYGGNPISKEVKDVIFSDNQIQKKAISGTEWYIFDRQLIQSGLDGLWLRGVVSQEQGVSQLSSIARLSILIIPLLLFIAIGGGYMIAGRTLKPIKEIAATTAQINKGSDLKKRIKIGDGTDEVHQLADSFNAMVERLDDSFEIGQRFTSDASHELRTPMSVIMAQCEYTLEDDRSAEEYRDSIKVIRRQGSKMTKLIDDMLTFTRLEQKSSRIKMIEMNFSELVSSIADDMSLIQDKGITLESSVEPGIIICGDAAMVTRLLNNLIGNAFRYGNANGHIFIELKSDNEQAVLSVRDDGIGISKEDQAHIFQRFFQADHARSGIGTGLGLSMAQEIAHFHEGELSVKSELGTGSTFIFKIKKYNS